MLLTEKYVLHFIVKQSKAINILQISKMCWNAKSTPSSTLCSRHRQQHNRSPQTTIGINNNNNNNSKKIKLTGLPTNTS